MKAKILEIRDRGTFFPALCVDMNPANDEPYGTGRRYLLRRVGYPCDGKPNIAMTHAAASGYPCTNDPAAWSGRTYPVAHRYIIDHWNELIDGDVVDVEYILGETTVAKVSERFEVEP